MKSLFKKLTSFSIGPIGVAALGFLMTATITHIISPDEYGRTGMFQTAQTLISMFTLLAMNQAYARDFVLMKQEKRNALLIDAMLLPLLLSVLVSISLLLFRSWYSTVLFGSATETMAIYLMSLMFPCMVVDNFCQIRIRVEENGLLYSALTVSLKALSLAFSVGLLLLYERSYRSVVYGLALAEISLGIVAAVIVLRKEPLLTFRPDWPAISNMLRFALPLFPAVILTQIFVSSDQLMLRVLSNYTELGLYTAAHKVVAIVSVVSSCFTTLWPPVSFRWYESRRNPAWFDLVMWAVGLLIAEIGLGLMLCKDFVALVLGDGFRRAISIFPFLLLNPVMHTMSEASMIGIPFSKKTGYNVAVSGVTVAINLILNYILIPILGGRGAAIATGLSYVVFFWAATLISRKLWRPFPIAHFFMDILVLIVNCYVHTFFCGPVPYLISAASITGLIIINIPKMKKAWSMLRQV